jgi:anti-sigma factor RsiW
MPGPIKNAFDRLVWKYLPGCREITALISRAMEDDLSRRERLVLRAHLYTCLACRRYLSQLRFLREVFARREAPPAGAEEPARLGPETAERLKTALRSARLLLFFVLLNAD